LGPVADEIERMMDPSRTPSSILAAHGPMVEFHTPTLTVNIPKPKYNSPGFFSKIPPAALMFLAALTVVAGAMAVYAILRVTHVL
jgi:hypothetical protein